MKKGTLAKLILSIALLLFFGRKLNVDSFLGHLSAIPWWMIVLIVTGYIAGQFLSVTKWWWIARLSGMNVTYWKVIRSYFSGMFVNLFGLGLAGGDVARALLLAGREESKSKAFATVVADRIHGLGVLALIGLISTACFGRLSMSPELVYVLMAASGGIVLGWFLVGPISSFLYSKTSRPFFRKLLSMEEAFPRAGWPLLGLSIISALFHLSQISLYLLVVHAVGGSVPFSVLLVAIPFVNIVSSLPISWNGVGLREGGVKFFLVPMYISKEQAILVGALWLFAITISSALGGFLALWSGDMATLRQQNSASSKDGSSSVSNQSDSVAPNREPARADSTNAHQSNELLAQSGK